MKNKLYLALLSLALLSACSNNEINNSATEVKQTEIKKGEQKNASNTWTLINSKIDFVNVKINKSFNSISEFGNLSATSATLDKTGKFQMLVDLDSVKTDIAIRDQRIKDLLFEVAKFPNATINAQLDPYMIKGLEAGQSLLLSQPIQLDIHGQRIQLQSELSIYRGKNNITVTTKSPVILDVNKMKMGEGLQKLVDVMDLSSIVQQVFVSFSGEFIRQEVK